MAQGERNYIVIDVDTLASSMENEIGNIHQLSLSPDYCIFKTPSILARHSPKAYSPNCFSFGPFHHTNPNLKVTEKIKFKYLGSLLSRWNDPKIKLKECLKSIKDIEGKARNCYAGYDGHFSEHNNFVKLLVLDGCFIVELFRKDAKVVTKEDDDPIFSMSCMLQFLHHDLILLENQIPWIVLERLFDITKGPSEIKSLIELALHFFGNLVSSHTPNLNADQLFANQKPIPSVTRLEEAGVEFIGVKKVGSILDIKFEKGRLQIPSLLIQETTETIFRNLISYEQCLPNCKPIFTSYAKIMDNLIDTTEDMETLCKMNVFDNWLSPEDATQFFNKLYNDTYVKQFYYSKLCNEVNGHCQKWWPTWRAAYVHNYFSKPWAVAAQIYAIIMFILTLWQTCKPSN
ncbi:hypothetical protein COLO4_17165 [Corchorus olitorius]|uniref:Uncharacterized protein n=1 Tax=Corchorus olitorius TaxID=93759 RepID=A0A1R3JDX6_9ROSI|nr:hypothetical protein COLO4_17165 [Corchorus olitorius]